MKKIGFFFSLLSCTILLTGCFDKVEDNEIIDDCAIPEECTEFIDENLSNKHFSAFGTEPYRDFEISDGIAKLSSPMYDTDYEEPVTITKEGENYYFKGEELEGEFIKNDCIDGGKGDLHNYTVAVAKFREYYYEGCGDDEDGIKMSDEEYELLNGNSDDRFLGYLKSCEGMIERQLDQSTINISHIWNSKMSVGESWKFEGNVIYEIDGESYQKDTICTFLSGDFTDGLEFGNGDDEYGGFGYIIEKSDEEQECINTLDQYLPERMPGYPETVITVSCAGVDYGNSFVTGYIYTTTYPDLGLIISTPEGRRYYDEDSIFKVKADKPAFIRNGNRISYIHPRAGEEMEYIQVFEKSENEPLKDIIENKHTNGKCSLFESSYYHQNKVFAPYPGIIIYGIYEGAERKDCIIDNGENKGLVRFFESPDQTKYYKLDFMDGCAPGPCSIFGEIEIF